MFIFQLIIFQAILFAGLALLLKKLMGRHATTATAHLQQLTQEYLKKQEEVKKRLEKSEQLHQELVAKAEGEAERIKRQALAEAQEKKREILEEAHQESERIVAQGGQAREALKRELEASAEKRAVEEACGLIQQILPVQIQEDVHHRWIDEMIQNGLLRTEQAGLTEKVREVQIASAVALTPAQRGKIQRRLEESLGRSLTLKETVDPRLIAGLTITLGHLVVDGSLASKLKEATRRRTRSDG